MGSSLESFSRSAVLAFWAVLAIGSATQVAAQWIAPGFSPPLVWQRFGAYTFSTGPYRSYTNGQGGVYFVGNGGADVLAGRWVGEPMRVRELDGTWDDGFRPEVSGGFSSAVQPDGRLLMEVYTGGASVIVRLDSSGRLDPTFTPIGFSQGLRRLSALSGGKILAAVGGNVYASPSPWAIPTPSATLFRLHANGRVDDSFHRADFGSSILFARPVILTNGMMYVGGNFRTVDGESRSGVVRLRANGEVDPGFVGSASVPGGLGGTVRGIVVQSNDSVVVVGDLRIPSTAPSRDRIIAIRFTPDGLFDGEFPRYKPVDVGLTDYPRDVVALDDDRWVTVSSGLRRFNPDGTLDLTFRAPDFVTSAFWISRLSDGRFLVPGGEPAEGVQVFSAEGERDSSFRTGGFGRTGFTGDHVVLEGGRIAVSGDFNRIGDRVQLGLALLDGATGHAAVEQPDFTPLISGEATIGVGSQMWRLAPGAGDVVWVLGNLSDTNGVEQVFLARVRGDGPLDLDSDVREIAPAGPLGGAQGLASVVGGGVLVIADSAQGAVNGRMLMRLAPDGSVDPAFAGLDPAIASELARVTRNNDGALRGIELGALRVLARSGDTGWLAALNTIGGWSRIVRIDRDGRNDARFAGPEVSGLASTLEFREVVNPVTGMREQPEDAVTLYGESVFKDAVQLPSGQVLVCGRFHELGGVSVPYLARLESDGRVDRTFPGLRVEYSRGPYWEPTVDALEVDATGRIYVAGFFDRVNGVPAPGLARLLPDGRVDETFRSPIWMTPHLGAATDLQWSGADLLVFGAFAAVGDRTPRLGWRLQLEPPVVAPVIVESPASQTVGLGGTATFRVTAEGTAPLTYQWRKNGAMVAGATGPTLILENAQPADGGLYTVVVSNPVGSVESAAAALRVAIPSLAFADVFGDQGRLRSAAGIGGADNFTATVEAGEPLHAGKVGGRSMWITWRAPASGIATLRTTGSSFDTLLAVYTGTQVDRLVEVASDEDRGGFLASLVQFNAVAETDYQIVVDGFDGASGDLVLSWELEPTGQTLPVIVEPPQRQTVVAGASVTFRVAANGEGLTYQWFKNGVALAGAVQPALTLENVQTADVAHYVVRVANAEGRSVESLPAALELGVATQSLSEDKLADAVVGAAGPGVARRAWAWLAAGSGRGGSSDRSVAGGRAAADEAGLHGPFASVTLGGAGIAKQLNNVNATTEPGEPLHAGQLVVGSLWEVLVPDSDGVLEVQASSAELDPVLAVYTPIGPVFEGYDRLRLEGAASDISVATVRVTATGGKSYFVVVAGRKQPSGAGKAERGLVGLSARLGQAPQMVQGLANVAAVKAQTVTLTVTASGIPAVGFEWYHGAQRIAGQTGPTLVLSGVQPGQSGTYRCVARNWAGEAETAMVLTVAEPSLAWGGWRLRSGGRLELDVPSHATLPTVVQASEDLRTWTDIFTNAPLAAPVVFVDPAATVRPLRFYRLKQ